MANAAFACPKCHTEFAVEPGSWDLNSNCPTCNSLLEAHFFPSFFREPEKGNLSVPLADQTEASCFYHPQKQAQHVCDGCGRLICALCSIDLGGEHICPNCISAGRRKGKLATLEQGRTRYDSIAMSLSVIGLFLCYLSFFTAPAAIYVSIRHWKSPGGIMGGTRRRFVIAIILSTLEIMFWLTFLLFAIFARSRPHLHHHT